jgi:hypothetical protein
MKNAKTSTIDWEMLKLTLAVTEDRINELKQWSLENNNLFKSDIEEMEFSFSNMKSDLERILKGMGVIKNN